jgi:hypothetical protein
MAMKRSAIWMRVRDAFTGIPLNGTWGIILNWGRPDLRREDQKLKPGTDRLVISDAEWYSNPYQVRLWNWYYTNGPTQIDTVHLSYRTIWHQMPDVGIPQPQGNNINVVATWGMRDPGSTDMDLHVLFPTGRDTRCDVGDEPPLTSNPAFDCGRGSMRVEPYSQLMSESTEHGFNLEAIQLRMPVYASTYAYGGAVHEFPYYIFLTDHNEGRDIIDPDRGWPVIRVWQAGVMKRGPYRYGHATGIQGGPHIDPPLDPPGEPCTFLGGTAACSSWEVASSVDRAFYSEINTLGDGTTAAVIPY